MTLNPIIEMVFELTKFKVSLPTPEELKDWKDKLNFEEDIQCANLDLITTFPENKQ